MKVYVVKHLVDYEGDDVLFLFRSPKDAEDRVMSIVLARVDHGQFTTTVNKQGLLNINIYNRESYYVEEMVVL